MPKNVLLLSNPVFGFVSIFSFFFFSVPFSGYPVSPSASAQQSRKAEWFGVCLKREVRVEFTVGGVGMVCPTNQT